MLVASYEQQIAVMVVLHRHTAFAAELHVLGVKRRFHRRGIGRRLVDAAGAWAMDRHLRFLTVKTLSTAHPDANYAATRMFYEAVGFLPLEVLPTVWGEDLPCLLMVKTL